MKTKSFYHFIHYFFILLISIPCISYLCIGFYKSFFVTGDGMTRWKECAYLLLKINPLEISLGAKPPLEYIGNISRDVTTVPWSYLISNLLYPGFVSWRFAHVYSIILFAFLFVFTGYFFYQKIKQYSFSFVDRLFLLVILFSHCGWYSSLDKLNPGMYVCLCLILVMLICNFYLPSLKTDILISFLMTIAMLKPQVALLFFIPLFWQKRLRPIFLSGIYIIVSWGIVSLMCSSTPWDIILMQFQIGTSLETISGYVYYGILDFLILYGVPATYILMLEMLLFTILGFILGYFLHPYSIWIQFSVPALFSILWCYHHNMDIAIIGILMVTLGLLLLQKNSSLSKPEMFFCVILLVFNVIPISYTLYEKYPAVPIIQRIFYAIGLFIVLKHKNSLPKLQQCR